MKYSTSAEVFAQIEQHKENLKEMYKNPGPGAEECIEIELDEIEYLEGLLNDF